uniref:Venom peptide HtPi1 n=1 Tax=Hadogenes troglodytes TaxID=1577150 RepID=A0A1B3IJ46_9SCOR|nr:venom peptide HtPi1 [Hadogenes troglodytes]
MKISIFLFAFIYFSFSTTWIPGSAQMACRISGEVFTWCGTTCPLTCENFRNPPKHCPQGCFVGCMCKRGLVRHRNGRCVRPPRCYY